jgi:integrase
MHQPALQPAVRTTIPASHAPRRRRPSGDGAVYATRDGRWRGSVVVGWRPDPAHPRGQRPVRKYVTGRSERDAANKVRAVIRQRDAGRRSWTGTPTVAQWLDHWLTVIAPTRVRPSTIACYATASQRLTGHVGPRLRLDKLTTEHLYEVHARMRERGLKPATVRLQHRSIRRALQLAVRSGWLIRNPADDVELPAAQPPRVEPLTIEEARRVLAVAERRRNGARWVLALALGMRQGEVLGLTWPLVDLDAPAPCLHVRWALQRVKGHGKLLVPPKSAKSHRTLPLPPDLVECLRRHQHAQARERTELAAGWKGWTAVVDGREQPVHLVFAQPNGRPLNKEDDRREWLTLLAEAGVSVVRLHDARHTAATIMLTAGVPLRVVMEILGHSQFSLTANTYTHVPDLLRRDATVRAMSLLRPSEDLTHLGGAAEG